MTGACSSVFESTAPLTSSTGAGSAEASFSSFPLGRGSSVGFTSDFGSSFGLSSVLGASSFGTSSVSTAWFSGLACS